MENKEFTTVQVQGLSIDALYRRFDNLESQIKLLQPQPHQTSNKLMTREETAKLLGVSLVTLYNWVKANVLIAHRIGNKVRFKESEVFESLKQINSKR